MADTIQLLVTVNVRTVADYTLTTEDIVEGIRAAIEAFTSKH